VQAEERRTLKVKSTAIPDVKVITPVTYDDERGSFSEVYNRRVFARHGIDLAFVQDNCSFSQRKGTIRGLHFQLSPYAQHKLVRVSRGSIFDVAVDLRFGSPTYGRHVAVVLSRNEGNQLLVPVGFAHGFCTLEDETEVVYKVSEFYEPAYDSGIFWADSDLGIEWPTAPAAATLSAKDRALPPFERSSPIFHYSAHGSNQSDACRVGDDAA
jgi:dTDP-4-dehydrorhamnose 3,5-epimerase